MNRSTMFSARIIASIAIIAGFSLFLVRHFRNEPANVALRSEDLPGSIAESDSNTLKITNYPDRSNRRNRGTSEGDDDHGVAMEEGNRRALMGLIATMSEEDKNAKPEGYSMEYWAYFVAGHYQQLKQNGKIEFYGKVISEDGTPLRGVRVQASVPSYEDSLSKAVEMDRAMNREYFDVITDERGLFNINGKLGVKLILEELDIANYKLEQGSRLGFNFAPEEAEASLGPRHQADPESPVVFRMIKEGK